jgi:hypothetical protein
LVLGQTDSAPAAERARLTAPDPAAFVCGSASPAGAAARLVAAAPRKAAPALVDSAAGQIDATLRR